MVQVILFKLLYIVEETDVVDPPTMTTSLSGTARNDKKNIYHITGVNVTSTYIAQLLDGISNK